MVNKKSSIGLFNLFRVKDRPSSVNYTRWSPPTMPVKYPKYSYLYNVDNNKYYLILSHSKKEFISTRAFFSFSSTYLPTTTLAISKYPLYGKKGFRPGTIIRSTFDSKVYFVGEDFLHPITSSDFFSVLGFSDIIMVSSDEIDFYEIGDAIDGI